MQDIFYFIMTCEAYKNTRKPIQEKFLFKNKNNYLYISAKSDINNNIIGFETLDAHKDLKEKYIAFYKYFYDNQEQYKDYNYFLFIDDDALFIEHNLIRYLDDLIINDIPLIIGNLDCSWEGFTNFCGGAGILFNRKALLKICEYVKFTKELELVSHPTRGFSDVTLSRWCALLNIAVLHNTLMYAEYPERYGHNEEQIKRAITYHWVNELHYIYLQKLKLL